MKKTWTERLHSLSTILSTGGLSLLVGPDRKDRPVENPDTWDKPTKVVNAAITEARQGTPVPGPSLAGRIVQALRDEGLLNEESD